MATVSKSRRVVLRSLVTPPCILPPRPPVQCGTSERVPVLIRQQAPKPAPPEPATVNGFPVRGTNFVMVTGEEEKQVLLRWQDQPTRWKTTEPDSDVIANRRALDPVVVTAEEWRAAGLLRGWNPSSRVQRIIWCIANGMSTRATAELLGYQMRDVISIVLIFKNRAGIRNNKELQHDLGVLEPAEFRRRLVAICGSWCSQNGIGHPQDSTHPWACHNVQ